LGNSDKMRTHTHLGLAVLLVGFGAVNASADTLYSDVPVSILTAPVNGSTAIDFTSSVPYLADQVSAFGALISPTSTTETATQAIIALSNWGTAAMYGTTAPGYQTSVTLTLYNTGTPSTIANNIGGNDTVYTLGSVIESSTTTTFIQYRPNSAPNGDPAQFLCSDNINLSWNNQGNEQCGLVNLVTFDLSTTLPSSFIYLVSFATDPYSSTVRTNSNDSLNYGLIPIGTAPLNAPFAGSNPQPDTAYYVAACGSILNPVNCGGSATPGASIGDAPGWGSLGQSNIDIEGTPEPATFGLIGFGLVGLGIAARKKKKTKV